MKITKVVFIASFLLCLTHKHSITAQDYQDSGRSQTTARTPEQILEDLCMPVIISTEGLNEFYTTIYNKPEYGREVLPNNFCHLIQFLEHGKKTKLTKNYTQSVLRLFSNKLKSSAYVNAYAFAELASKMGTLLDHHFTVYRFDGTHLNTQLTDLLYESIVQKYPETDSPGTFCSSLSQEILDIIHAQGQTLNDVNTEELRKNVIIFFEIALNKLIWTPQDGIETWRTVKGIAENLTIMMDHSIIMDPDDLNDLFTTLLERYCFFLDVAGADMPLDSFSAIKSDINANSLLLLDLEEQDQLIKPKKQRLYRALIESEAKAKAYQEHGIITS